MDKNKIRNFAIVAHIDHGKSTLADRILELTKTISKFELREQHLDSMELEQEHGVTIKLNAVQIKYKEHYFHLIDTPGHVDFSYEVSRSLAAVEGVILLIDATQGIQAQTLANVYQVIAQNLKIIVVLNKIDLNTSNPELVKQQLQTTLSIKPEKVLEISAKTGFNVTKLLDKIITDIPAPIDGRLDSPLQALIFDSYFDPYRGVIILVRLFNGSLKLGDKIKFFNNQKAFKVTQLGVKNPDEIQKKTLSAGEVGWVSANIKNTADIAIGDTMTNLDNPCQKPLPGYQKLQPVVFSGFFPIDSSNHALFKDALDKISLSDSSITYTNEASQALGLGFRIGFLGMFHMEILQERLEREFNLNLIATAPSIKFEVHLSNKEIKYIDNPNHFPNFSSIECIKEPMTLATMIMPKEYIGNVMKLCQKNRGKFHKIEVIDHLRTRLIYNLPLLEIVFSFFDKLKSISKGYASFNYKIIGYHKNNLVKLDVLVNKVKVDALAIIIHKDFVYEKAKLLTQKLKEVIPRQNFEIPIQAAIGGKIIARETIKSYRKDVTAKLYGGDRTRKMKLLSKQKKGKKRMKQIGSVEIPQSAFLTILKALD